MILRYFRIVSDLMLFICFMLHLSDGFEVAARFNDYRKRWQWPSTTAWCRGWLLILHLWASLIRCGEVRWWRFLLFTRERCILLPAGLLFILLVIHGVDVIGRIGIILIITDFTAFFAIFQLVALLIQELVKFLIFIELWWLWCWRFEVCVWRGRRLFLLLTTTSS